MAKRATHKRNAHKSPKNYSKRGGLLHAAAEAGHELSAAVDSLGETWEHVERAQEKGEPATRVATRAGKKVVRAAKRALPGRRRR